MAHKFDCEVVGMDVQQSLIDGCSQLTNRMIDVKDKIKWIRGSATDPEAYRGLEGHFDGLYSMLTILHIPQSVSAHLSNFYAQACASYSDDLLTGSCLASCL